jgi:hypothetical protein
LTDTADYGLPEGAVITAELHIVEYIDPEDGVLMVFDLSKDGFGKELTLEMVRKLAAEAVFEYEAPLMAERVGQYLFGFDDEEDEDDGDEEVDEVQPVP